LSAPMVTWTRPPVAFWIVWMTSAMVCLVGEIDHDDGAVGEAYRQVGVVAADGAERDGLVAVDLDQRRRGRQLALVGDVNRADAEHRPPVTTAWTCTCGLSSVQVGQVRRAHARSSAAERSKLLLNPMLKTSCWLVLS